MNKLDMSETLERKPFASAGGKLPAFLSMLKNTPRAKARGVLDIIALAALFILAFSVWTIPFQQDERPFGEGDSAWHFSIGDYIAQNDVPVWRLPYYVGMWYYGYNSILGPFAPEYPPSNHYNYALMQLSGGERFVPVLIYRAVASFLGIFAVYFVISKLYNSSAALIAASALVFSVREQMIYLWGQQPTLVSVVISPITFYAFYRYLDAYYKKEPKPVYLYITAFLLGSQYLLHIQGFTLSALVIAAFTVLMYVRHRRLPILGEKKKHIALTAVLFLAIAAPFFLIYLGAPDLGGSSPDYSRVWKWNVDPQLLSQSYPAVYTTFSGEYPPAWVILPLMFIGIAFLLARRSSRDLLMLAWIIGIYLVLHVDLYLGVSQERSARLLIAEPALFYSLMAIGIIMPLQFILSHVKLPQVAKASAKFAVALIAVALIFNASAETTKATLSGSYQGIFRITPAQSELAGWLHDSVEENAYIYYLAGSDPYKIGNWQYPKMRWVLASSQRHVASFPGRITDNPDTRNSDFYFVFDYSDLAAILGSQPNNLQPAAGQSAQMLQQFESGHFAPEDALYNQNNIRVYEVEAENFR
ncbi:glycosyltransferase family 39 protein [Candidatus Woesearchaeota archaeon]|nr:glycosyltransferase family 39 protein [Candidatus Woesearchaeota archaeon]